MHNPYELARNTQENFGTVLLFAFGRDAIGPTINERFKGEWKFLNKLVYETSERRAGRALLEKAGVTFAVAGISWFGLRFHQKKKDAPWGGVQRGRGRIANPLFPL